jgi:hypothetical protein
MTLIIVGAGLIVVWRIVLRLATGARMKNTMVSQRWLEQHGRHKWS